MPGPPAAQGVPAVWGPTCLEITRRCAVRGVELTKVLRAHRSATADSLTAADLGAALGTLGVPFSPQRTLAMHAALAECGATTTARMASAIARCALQAEHDEHAGRRVGFFDELATSVRPAAFSKADVVGDLARRLAGMPPAAARAWLARGRRFDALDRGALTTAELDRWLQELNLALDDAALVALAARFPSRSSRPGEVLVDDAALVRTVHPELAAERRQVALASAGVDNTAPPTFCWATPRAGKPSHDAFHETPGVYSNEEPVGERALSMTPKNDIAFRLANALEARGIAQHAIARAFVSAGADPAGTATARQCSAALQALGVTLGTDVEALARIARRFPPRGVSADDDASAARAGMARALVEGRNDALDLLTLDWRALAEATRPSHAKGSARSYGGARSAVAHLGAPGTDAERLEQLVRNEPAIVALTATYRSSMEMCHSASDLLRLLIETKCFERGRDVRSFFRSLDADASGRVDKHELGARLEAIGAGLTPAVLDLLFALLDPDGDGTVNYRHLAHFLRQSGDGEAVGTLAGRWGTDTFTPSEPAAPETFSPLARLLRLPEASGVVRMLARKAHEKTARVDAQMRKYADGDTGYLDAARVVAFSEHVGAPVSMHVAKLLLDAVGEASGLASPYALASSLASIFYSAGALGYNPVRAPREGAYSPSKSPNDAWLSPRGEDGHVQATRILHGDPAHRGDLLVAIADKAHQRGFNTARILSLFGHGVGRWSAQLQTVTREQVIAVVARLGWQLTDAEADKLMSYFDVNRDGTVSPLEVAEAFEMALTREGYDTTTVAPAAARDATLNLAQRRHLAQERTRAAREAEISQTLPGHGMSEWGAAQQIATKGDLLARIALKAEQRAKSFSALFRLFNCDGDGRLSPDEVRRGVSLLGWELTDEELGGLCAQFDIDGDGSVGLRELALAIEQTIGRFK